MIVLASSSSSSNVFDLKTIVDKDNQASSIHHYYESQKWIYQEFLPKMIEQNYGHLVLVSSETAVYDLPFKSTISSLQIAQIKRVECVDAELYAGNKNNQIKYSIVYLNAKENEDTCKNVVKSILKNETHIFLPRYLNYINMLKTILPVKCFNLLFNTSILVKNKKNN
jgi:hypothetical protein